MVRWAGQPALSFSLDAAAGDAEGERGGLADPLFLYHFSANISPIRTITSFEKHVTATANVNADGGLDVDDTFVVADGGAVSSLSLSDTSVPLTGASFEFDFNNAADRTMTVTNSNGSAVANFSVEALITAGNGLTVTTGTVSLPADQVDPAEINDNGITLDAGEDELCLSYVVTGGYFEYVSCGGGSQIPWTGTLMLMALT